MFYKRQVQAEPGQEVAPNSSSASVHGVTAFLAHGWFLSEVS